MKALILDDEFMHAEYLSELLKRHTPAIEQVQVFTDAIEALKYINKHSLDVLFLDVEMPQLSGFDLLEILPKANSPAVVFTSAHSKYALQAFDIAATHYLLKPIDPSKLQEAVERIISQRQAQSDAAASDAAPTYGSSTISLPEGQNYHIVKLENIVRVEGSGSYATFFLNDNQKIMVSKRLKFYADQLSSKGFVRTHQSHLVNEQYIKIYSRSDGSFLTLEDGSQIPVSAKIKPELKKRLKL